MSTADVEPIQVMEVENDTDSPSKMDILAIENPMQNIINLLKRELVVASKIANGVRSVNKMSQQQRQQHRARLSHCKLLFQAMSSPNTDTAFIIAAKNGRIVVPPKTSQISVVAVQSLATPQVVGGAEVSDFLKAEYDAAAAIRSGGLHKGSFKINMAAMESAMLALPAESLDVLSNGLEPRFSHDDETGERNTTPRDDTDDGHGKKKSKKVDVVVSSGPNDYWTPAQKLARLLPGFYEGESNTGFRGNNADEKAFWVFTATLTNRLELPEQGSDEAKALAHKIHSHFYIQTADSVEPLLATDGMPVRANGAMLAAIETGEVYERPQDDDALGIKYELVYTIAMPDGMTPYQGWCEFSQDYRHQIRCSPRMLNWVLEISQKLLGGDRGDGVPQLIKNWFQTNPSCKEILNINSIACAACRDWRHPSADDADGDDTAPSPETMLEIMSTWRDAAWCNPSFSIKKADGDVKNEVFFASTPEERARLAETFLRVGAYDSTEYTVPSLKELRKEFIPIIGDAVCAAKGIDAGARSRVSTALVVESAPAAVGAGSRKRKHTTQIPTGLMDIPAQMNHLIAVMESTKTELSSVMQELSSLKTEVSVDSSRNSKFRRLMRQHFELPVAVANADDA